jgi:hypothetical protein
MTQLNEAQLVARIRTIAMDRVEAGLRVGGDYAVEMLKAIVSEPAAPDLSRPTSTIPFFYVDTNGRKRRGRRGKQWQPNGPVAEAFTRQGPPGMRSGAGRDSIKFQIVDRDDQAGTIKLRIGVDASAPGGMHTLRSYLFGHEIGIRYPTVGPAKGLGAVVQHPWLRNGVRRYLPEVQQVVTDTVEGIE